jgi:signal transduction histidine kinase
MQESLNNIAKHAHARSVQIELTRRNDRISLVVSDDGDGFDAAAAAGMAGGIGLATMRERAEELGGVLTVASAPGEGATISLSIPIE